MTVCIAAISGRTMIVGAADRMITAQDVDVEFEPSTQKILSMSSSIYLMNAGDSALQSEIIQSVWHEVTNRIKADPSNWWRVEDVADLYVKWYSHAKIKRSEAKLLAPLGLNRNTFIERQHEMANVFIDTIAQQMVNFKLPSIETIVTGIDPTGPHIYVIEDGEINCFDGVGFAAIGSGARHAQSQFMSARYSQEQEIPETMITTFFAKRRAEVAPGVGKDTDMFILGPRLGDGFPIVDEFLKVLDEAYNKNAEIEKEARLLIQADVRKYLEEKSKIEPQGQQQPTNISEVDSKRIPPTGDAV